jgi:dTDP-glucose 4,6-dehydratase
LGKGHVVTVYDKLDLRVVNPRALQWMEVEHCNIVEGDIRDEPKLIDVMGRQDLVIHTAAQSAVDLSIKDPVTTFVTNALGTVRVLEAMRRSGVKRLHYVSTDEVFGAATDCPFTEHSLVRPRNPYSAGKAAGEAAIFAWANTYGIEVTITNGCNNYGPRQAPEKLIPRLTIRGIIGKSLPVYGDGMQVREWLHVDDHAEEPSGMSSNTASRAIVTALAVQLQLTCRSCEKFWKRWHWMNPGSSSLRTVWDTMRGMQST